MSIDLKVGELSALRDKAKRLEALVNKNAPKLDQADRGARKKLEYLNRCTAGLERDIASIKLCLQLVESHSAELFSKSAKDKNNRRSSK